MGEGAVFRPVAIGRTENARGLGLKARDDLRRGLCFFRVGKRLAGGVGFGAPRLQLLRRHIATKGVTALKHGMRDLCMPLRTGELEHGLAVPIEPQPCHAVEDRGDGGFRRARAVGVFDAEQEFAARVTRIKPIEQRGARAADMQKAGRRRSKARNHAGLQCHRDSFRWTGSSAQPLRGRRALIAPYIMRRLGLVVAAPKAVKQDCSAPRRIAFPTAGCPYFLPTIGGKKIRWVENILECVMSTNSFLSLLFLYYLIIPHRSLRAR